MELPQQQQQQPTAPLLGQGAGEQGMSPELLAGLGLGGGIVAGQVGGAPSTSMRLSPFAQGIADLDANRLAQQGRPNLIGTPQTTTTTPRVVGPNTPPTYTGPSPARPVPGTQMVPTGQAPAIGSQGGSPAIRPAQVTSVKTVPRGAPLLGQASQLSRASGPLALYTLADVGVQQMTGQGISSRVGEGLGGLIGSAIYGDTSQPAFTQEERAASIANNQPIDLGTLERQSAPAQEADPIRSTFTLPNGEVVMERESGERFTPTAEQLQTFNSTMQSVSQPTATGMGVGGDEGVVFGGGQAPMSTEATQEMLQERFGAPTISAIQSLPAGQGSGMQTDAQGRMIDPNADRSDFDRASAARQASIGGTGSFAGDSMAREARLAERDRRPGESQTQRDTRIADSRTQGASSGGLTMEAATRLTGGDRDAARALREKQRQETQEPSNLEVVNLDGFNVLLENGEYKMATKGDGSEVTTPAAIETLKYKNEQRKKARELYEQGKVTEADDLLAALGYKDIIGKPQTAEEAFGQNQDNLPSEVQGEVSIEGHQQANQAAKDSGQTTYTVGGQTFQVQ